MISKINKQALLPRLNMLAACLALAFSASVGANSTTAAQIAAPRSNHMGLDQHSAQRNGAALNRAHRRAPPQPYASRNAPTRPTATFAVTNCLDDGSAGSLRTVLASAVTDGDVVDMRALTCSKITLATGALSSTAEVILQGPGQGKLSIDGNAAGAVLVADKSLTVNDLTITNGNYQYGGCLRVNGNLYLNSSTVSGCVAGDANAVGAFGGGADIFGNLQMYASTLSGNTVTAKTYAVGGGAYVEGSAYLANSTVSGNIANAVSLATASYPQPYATGGGLNVYSEQAVLLGSVISDNTASSVAGTAYGGGVFAEGHYGVAPSAHLILSAFSTISGNTAHSGSGWSYGGGLATGKSGGTSGAIYLAASTLTGNTVSSACSDCVIQGGGASAFGQIIVTGATVRNNKAVLTGPSTGVAYGGGIATRSSSYNNHNDSYYGVIRTRESTISGNSAVGGASGFGRGGGVAALLSPVDVENSTVAFNTASSSGGGAVEGASGLSAGFDSLLTSSVLANNQAPNGADIATVSSSNTIRIGGANNLVMSASSRIQLPADTLVSAPMLLPLACNGGPTATHALGAGSPAIDTGAGTDTSDQRLAPFVRSSGAGVDIGSFEVQPAPDSIFTDGFDKSGLGQACGGTIVGP